MESTLSDFYFSKGKSQSTGSGIEAVSGANLKQNYKKPELILYGVVGNLTQATSIRGTEGMATMDMVATGSMA